MTNEIKWVGAPGFEGRYMVSDSGEVSSVRFYGKCDYSKNLKPRKTKKGYLRVHLGSRGDKYIHRLVAALFVPNPNNYNEVNHIDFNKENNAASNLEWCSHAHNMSHANRHGRIIFSDEARKKISEGRKRYWRERKLSLNN